MNEELRTKLLGNLRNINWIMARTMHKMFIALDVSPVQGMMLMALDKEGGKMSSGALAESMHTPASNITKITERLIKSGYLIKEKDSADKRTSCISLTDDGKKILEEFKARHDETMKKIEIKCDENELEGLIDSLIRLNEILKSAFSDLDA